MVKSKDLQSRDFLDREEGNGEGRRIYKSCNALISRGGSGISCALHQ